MKRTVRLLAAAAALLTLAPAAFAGTVSGLAVTGGATHNPGVETSIEVTGTADFAGDVPGEAQVFTDGTLDGILLGEATPPFTDLVTGYIEETPTAINFSWQVVDWPDIPGFVPAVTYFFWEFQIGTTRYAVSANVDVVGAGQGGLESEPCTQTGNILTCTPVEGAVVTVTHSGATNRITASVRRSDLGPAAVDGARLSEVVLFRGIASFIGLLLVPAATGDEADMARPYVLGPHVEVGLAPAGLSDDDLRDPLNGFFPGSTDVPGAGGSFAVDVPIEGLPPGDYEAVAQACLGGLCTGPIVRASVQLVV